MAFAQLTFGACMVVVLIIVAASAITSVTGMAGGLLMFSGMGLFILLQPLIAVHGTVRVFDNAARVWLLRHALHWRLPLPVLPFNCAARCGRVEEEPWKSRTGS